MAKVGKRTRAAHEAFAGQENVTVEEAVSLVKANATAKFDETIEIAMNLGVDPRHADQMVRGSVSLPKGIGKSKRVIAFCEPNAALSGGGRRRERGRGGQGMGLNWIVVCWKYEEGCMNGVINCLNAGSV